MEKVLGVKVLGIIPEDPNVRRSAAARSPIVIAYPESPASKAIRRIASDLSGVAYTEDDTAAVPREGFIDRFSRVLFRRKPGGQ
jgi:septum site-determining protein MinD